MRIMTSSVVGLIALASGIGCGGSIPVPNDQFAAAQADVGRAQAGGAPEVPDAKLHLQLAMEDLQKAKQMMDEDKDNAHAERLTAVASAEAQLALSLAREAAARAQAQAAETELRKDAQR